MNKISLLTIIALTLICISGIASDKKPQLPKPLTGDDICGRSFCGCWSDTELNFKTKTQDNSGRPITGIELRCKSETDPIAVSDDDGNISFSIETRTSPGCGYARCRNLIFKDPNGEFLELTATVFQKNNDITVLQRQLERPPKIEPEPVSVGVIDVQQTYTFDLDQGQIGGDNSEIWFEAVTRDSMFFTPRNDALMSLGDGSRRGYAGCSNAYYSDNQVSLHDIPVGSYICVLTNEGRVSQFRVNNISGNRLKTISIGYTTWKKQGGTFNPKIISPKDDDNCRKKPGNCPDYDWPPGRSNLELD